MRLCDCDFPHFLDCASIVAVPRQSFASSTWNVTTCYGAANSVAATSRLEVWRGRVTGEGRAPTLWGRRKRSEWPRLHEGSLEKAATLEAPRHGIGTNYKLIYATCLSQFLPSPDFSILSLPRSLYKYSSWLDWSWQAGPVTIDPIYILLVTTKLIAVIGILLYRVSLEVSCTVRRANPCYNAWRKSKSSRHCISFFFISLSLFVFTLASCSPMLACFVLTDEVICPER